MPLLPAGAGAGNVRRAGAGGAGRTDGAGAELVPGPLHDPALLDGRAVLPSYRADQHAVWIAGESASDYAGRAGAPRGPAPPARGGALGRAGSDGDAPVRCPRAAAAVADHRLAAGGRGGSTGPA